MFGRCVFVIITGRSPTAIVMLVLRRSCSFPFSTIDTPNVEEEEYEGEALAGGDQGQPVTTGKPSFDLAFLNPIYTAYALICENAFFSWYQSCLWHFDTPLRLLPLTSTALV